MAQRREDHRGFDRELAEQLAPSWEARRADIEATAAPVRAWLVDELDPQPGDTVLELAAGVGDTGYEAASRLGDGGHLISTDVSEGMLAAARRRAAELGVTNVEHRVIDAEHIELDDDSVDGVLCRFCYMLLADPAAALAETHRVLRPGHRACLAVWGAPEKNPFFTTIVAALVQQGLLEPPDPARPGVFAMADPGRTTGLLDGAGFRHVRTAEVPVRFAVPDVDDYVQMIADTAGPIALAVRALSAEDRAAVSARCEAAMEPYEAKAGAGYEVPGVALCAVAE